ncbi:MAG: hypothetical protein ABH865_07385 [Candidatus Omnitrophota bacterium]
MRLRFCITIATTISYVSSMYPRFAGIFPVDRQEKIPLRLEFVGLAGKIVIVSENIS